MTPTQKSVSSTNEFKKLLDQIQFKIPKIGETIKGTVLSATKNEVKIDILGLTTGVVRGRELYNESAEYSSLKPGDEVEATVVDLENENGEIELSFRYAGHQKTWEKLNDLREKKEIVKAKIIEANKGGLLIQVDHVPGFLPVSQLNPEHYPRVPGGDKTKIIEKLKEFIGTLVDVKIIDANESEEKLIVSEKAAWEDSQKSIISQYKIGDIVTGKLTAITDFGVFIEFGEKEKLEGLIHISELAWQRIENPRDFIKIGQEVSAEIINIENSKIFLSMKKLKTDPWKDVEKKYQPNQMVKGKVLKINPFGLFVELDPEIHGLAHISELSDKTPIKIDEIAKIGDTLEFRIVSIEAKDHRLGLSLKKQKKEEPKKEDVKEKAESKKEEKSETETKETKEPEEKKEETK